MVGVHWTWRLVYNTQVNLHCHAETLISSWIVASALLIYFFYLRLYKLRSNATQNNNSATHIATVPFSMKEN